MVTGFLRKEDVGIREFAYLLNIIRSSNFMISTQIRTITGKSFEAKGMLGFILRLIVERQFKFGLAHQS